MKRALTILLLLMAPAVAAVAQEKPAETPSFPSTVELVTVDTVVTDKKGAPVTGLTQDDFLLTEDGKPQAVVSFEAVQLPPAPPAPAAPPPKPSVSTNTAAEAKTARTFVVLFDDVHMAPVQAQRAKVAVAQFLKSGVREGDHVTLVSTGGDAWWTTRMEAGRDELLVLLKRLEGRHVPDTGNDRMSDYEALRIHIYSDPEIVQRVTRRYATYGVTPDDPLRRSQTSTTDLAGDPLVRNKAADVYYQSTSRNQIALGVMKRVLDALALARGRKTMILVSEGFIYDSNLDEFKRVLQASRRANCAIYFLDTRGLQGLPSFFGAEFGPSMETRDVGPVLGEMSEASQGSENLAADSGGFSVKNTNDLTKGIQQIADDSRAYYLLGYHPTNTARDGRFRKIKVEVKRKGVEVRARKGYYAPLEGAKAPEKAGKIDAAFQLALDSPFAQEDVPLRMAAYVFDETLLGKAKVVIATDVDVRNFAFEEKQGRLTDAAEFLLVAAHRETGEYYRYDQKVEMKLLPETREKLYASWLPIRREFELAPGGYQAKIVVRDRNGGKLGTVTHEFDVPPLGELRVSSPVISDTLQPAADGTPTPAPRPLLLVRRTFAPGATLYCSFEVYGAQKDKASGMPKVSAGYAIRGSDGATLTDVAPTPITPTSLGKLSRLMRTSLAGAAPGNYELVLRLRDELSGRTLEVREPFSVGPAT